jgi:transcriptional regulator with XRE-family HTH domain
VKKRSPDHVALGAAVRQVREERGISQERLGLESGLDRTYIGGIERGERNPSYANILLVARTLGVRASVLIAAAEDRQQR